MDQLWPGQALELSAPGPHPSPASEPWCAHVLVSKSAQVFLVPARAETTAFVRAVSVHRGRLQARLQRTAGGVGAVCGPEDP